MNTAAERYLTEIVEPTIRNFEENPTSLRHAFLACLATFHAIDRFENKGNLRKKFRDTLPEFSIVDRVAHAFKHIVSGNRSDPNNQPLNIENIVQRPPAKCGRMRCGLSRLGDSSGGVTIVPEINNDILRAVKKTAAFLRDNAEF